MSSHLGWPSDPEVLAFIEETAKHYPDEANRASAVEARRHYNRLCKAFDVPHPECVSTNDGVISANEPSRDLPFRHYTSDPGSTSALVYLHGGGWIVGGLDSHDSICADICAETRMDVLALDYRLCPEHTHPAALMDGVVGFAHFRDRYEHVFVGGDSAGGHLTAALCLYLRDRGEQQPTGQLLIYPALGAVPEGGSYNGNSDSPGLKTSDVVHYWNVLAGENEWRASDDPCLVPLKARHFSDLPPAVITSAGCDPLRDDAMFYANRLTEAGVPVQWRNDPQLIHGHLRARHMSRTAAAHFGWICSALVNLAAS